VRFQQEIGGRSRLRPEFVGNFRYTGKLKIKDHDKSLEFLCIEMQEL